MPIQQGEATVSGRVLRSSSSLSDRDHQTKQSPCDKSTEEMQEFTVNFSNEGTDYMVKGQVHESIYSVLMAQEVICARVAKEKGKEMHLLGKKGVEGYVNLGMPLACLPKNSHFEIKFYAVKKGTDAEGETIKDALCKDGRFLPLLEQEEWGLVENKKFICSGYTVDSLANRCFDVEVKIKRRGKTRNDLGNEQSSMAPKEVPEKTYDYFKSVVLELYPDLKKQSEMIDEFFSEAFKKGKSSGAVFKLYKENFGKETKNSTLVRVFKCLSVRSDSVGYITWDSNEGGSATCFVLQDGQEKSIDGCTVVPVCERGRVCNHRVKCGEKEACNDNNCGPGGPKGQECIHMFTQRSFHDVVNNPNVVTYDTSFFGGSSGSPVFDTAGQLVAMHAAGYKYVNKRQPCSIVEFGYSLVAIIAAMKEKHKACENRHLVLTTLHGKGQGFRVSLHLLQDLHCDPKNLSSALLSLKIERPSSPSTENQNCNGIRTPKLHTQGLVRFTIDAKGVKHVIEGEADESISRAMRKWEDNSGLMLTKKNKDIWLLGQDMIEGASGQLIAMHAGGYVYNYHEQEHSIIEWGYSMEAIFKDLENKVPGWFESRGFMRGSEGPTGGNEADVRKLPADVIMESDSGSE
ncbi:protein FAM111A isoform B [Alligator mississippiensis]|uniref:Protein FAM111A isoform B n=1 Tax=Alligator mississippiensis TaxID=8496 RepID=A0A151NVP5_ALLMI|nr:protein FAM111A isoform B [Alligator mississippiensis]